VLDMLQKVENSYFQTFATLMKYGMHTRKYRDHLTGSSYVKSLSLKMRNSVHYVFTQGSALHGCCQTPKGTQYL
jgi:hypothetical protein